MADKKKIAARVTAQVKKLDAESIVQGTLLDQASGRLIITLVKGPRRILFNIPSRWFENGSPDRVDLAIKDAVERLQHTPIG